MLAHLKRNPAWLEVLSPDGRKVIAHAIRKYLSPDEGITASQGKLAKGCGVCRETVNRQLGKAVDAGLLSAVSRSRSKGTPGRTTNAYKVVQLVAPEPLQLVTPEPLSEVSPVTAGVTAEGYWSNPLEGCYAPPYNIQMDGHAVHEVSQVAAEVAAPQLTTAASKQDHLITACPSWERPDDYVNGLVDRGVVPSGPEAQALFLEIQQRRLQHVA